MCFHLLARPGRIRRIRSALLRSRALRIAQAVQAVQPWQWCRLTGLQVARGSHRRQALRTQASAAHSTLLHLGMHAARETDAATDTGSVPPPAPVLSPRSVICRHDAARSVIFRRIACDSQEEHELCDSRRQNLPKHITCVHA